MAGDNKVRAIDIGQGWWQDIDTPKMFQHAEEEMTKRRHAQLNKTGHHSGRQPKLGSRLARNDIAGGHARSDRRYRAENQGSGSNDRPKVKDPVSQAE